MEQIIYIPRVIKMGVSIYKIQLGTYFLELRWIFAENLAKFNPPK